MKQAKVLASFEFIDRRSRFIAEIRTFTGASGVKPLINQLRKKHKKARHVVYAFREDKNGRIDEGYSDDREPRGTAGKPVLFMMRGEELSGYIITVVRYFGGTKLGTGGLVKAYTAAAKGAVNQLK